MRKNILIVIPQLFGGGAEKVGAIVSRLMSTMHNVFVAVFNETEHKHPHGGELIVIKSENYRNRFHTFLHRIKELRKIKRDNRINVAISFLTNPNLLNVLSKKNEKTVISIRSNQSYAQKNVINIFKVRYTIRKADAVVAISEGVNKDLVNVFKAPQEKVETIYNPCDCSQIKKMADMLCEEIQFEKGLKYIVTVGSIRKCKGHVQLLKSFYLIREKHPEVRLIIVGEKREETLINETINNLKLSEYVILVGEVSNPYKIMIRSDIFVLSSIYEGLSNAIIEALACSKAVVASDCYSGPREVLAPDTDADYRTDVIDYAKYGILVPSFDLKGEDNSDMSFNRNIRLFAEAVCILLENEDIKCGYEANAISRALDFSEERIRDEWVSLIDKL